MCTITSSFNLGAKFMEKDIIKGHWKEIKGKLRQQWGQFSEDEISEMVGTYEELIGQLQKKYGYGKDQAKKEIAAFLQRNKWSD